MRHRKGWIKIFEASIAITLIMGFMVLVYSQTIEKPPTGENIVKWQTSILDELKNEPALRQDILSNPDTVCNPDEGGPVYGFIWARITKVFPGFGFSCKVCNPGDICGIPTYKSAVYSEERIISSTLTTFSPKKIKLFVWPLEPDEAAPTVPVAPPVTPPTPPTPPTPGPLAVSNLVCGTVPQMSGPVSIPSTGIPCNWINPVSDLEFTIKVFVGSQQIATLDKTVTNFNVGSNNLLAGTNNIKFEIYSGETSLGTGATEVCAYTGTQYQCN